MMRLSSALKKMEENKPSVQRDLTMILIIMAVLLIATGILFAVDSSRDLVSTWAEQLYSFLLRR